MIQNETVKYAVQGLGMRAPEATYSLHAQPCAIPVALEKLTSKDCTFSVMSRRIYEFLLEAGRVD